MADRCFRSNKCSLCIPEASEKRGEREKSDNMSYNICKIKQASIQIEHHL